jgi:uncharacterized protein (DUF1684 family)
LTAFPSYGRLWDYRRRVEQIYHRVRDTGVSQRSWERWRTDRDDLFATHPASPIPQDRRPGFTGLPFPPYDPSWSLTSRLVPVEPEAIGVVHSGEGSTPMVRFAEVDVDSPQGRFTLDVYWMDVYGGGVFLPFRDSTNGSATYGGGRYLLDTAKSADLGDRDGELALDFNFAFHPSCTHDARWSCPLAPRANTLDIPIPVGEQLASGRPPFSLDPRGEGRYRGFEQ